jgi:DnaK suppressor protein
MKKVKSAKTSGKSANPREASKSRKSSVAETAAKPDRDGSGSKVSKKKQPANAKTLRLSLPEKSADQGPERGGGRVPFPAKKALKKDASRGAPSRSASGAGKPQGAARNANSRQLDQFRKALLLKKESLTRHLQNELSGLETIDKHHLADLEEMASDTQETDSVCEIMEIGADTLDQIELALNKIEDGTYGLCEECEGEIPFERLEALPFATLCVACKRKQELKQITRPLP